MNEQASDKKQEKETKAAEKRPLFSAAPKARRMRADRPARN